MLMLKEEHHQVRDMVRRFAEDVVAPRARELDETESFPHEAVKGMAELGLLGLPYPEQYGGAGMDTLSYAIAVEELARVCASTAITYAAHVSLGCGPVYANGSEAQKQRFLVPMAKGEALGAFGLTEPNAGSDAASLTTKARRDGAHYVLDGAKAFISGGVVVHQYSKIGRLVMIGGNTRVNLDVPPYFLYTDFNVTPCGLNLVGLKRAGFTHTQVQALKTAYKLLYRSNLKLDDALARIEIDVPTEHTLHLVRFIQSSKRGICRE